MRENGLSRFAIKQYTINGRHFLRHISRRGARIDRIQPDDVAAYLRLRRREYQRRRGHMPEDDTDWRSRYTASIHMLLRLAQGVWPPPTALESCVASFKEMLQKEHLRPGTVRQYVEQARLFLAYLERQGLRIGDAKPKHVDAFIADRLRIYRKKHGRRPRRLIHWRAEHTKGVHCLLRDAQTQWPPASSVDGTLQRFKEHLIERGWRPHYAKYYRNRAQQFTRYLDERGLSLSTVIPADVTAYLRVGFREYSKRRSNPPNAQHWRMMNERAVHSLLRFVQGEWPPGSGPPQALADFRGYLEEHRYSPAVIPSCVSAARQFLLHLKGRGVSVQEARPADVEKFLDTKLERYKRRYRCLPRNPQQWRAGYTGPIHRMLRMINPEWPPPEPPPDAQERFRREVLNGYGRWLVDIRGLSQSTLRKNGDAARMFLEWLGARANRDSLRQLLVHDIDGYLSWRLPRLRRATRYGVVICLRSFLGYLFAEGLITRDLAPSVSGPILYQFDEIPRAFTREQVEAMLRAAGADRSPLGLRDHAILLLLATYGLRAGEVARLRLDDIDWREERLRVRQSKTCAESHVPLVRPVGEALLKYIRKGRPATDAREVFMCSRAPYAPFRGGSSLYAVVGRRLRQAGIEVQGRHGSHAFRFARAGTLLDAEVPLKTIGDLLGHRSATSTEVYLRLVTDDLRAISLDLPRKEDRCPRGRTKTKHS
jgi:site-specific recombinase XerD